jgi:acetate kinase
MNEGYDSDSINDMLNLHSGLEGIAGTSDMREVSHRSQSDPDAKLARDMYIARVVHYIGAYLARVPGVEVLVLTGGIGENDENLRSVIVSKLEHLGVGSTINVLVIPTNEELAIARECWKVGKK